MASPYPYPYPYPPRRPGSITTLAVLNLVFGGLGVIGLLFTGAMYFGGMSLGPRNPVVEIARESPAYMSYLEWSLLLGLLMVLALVCSGIGLLKMKMWGRKLAILYSVVNIISAVVGLVMTQHYVLGPLAEQHDRVASAGAMGGYAGGIVSLAYPLILLAFMFKRTVVTALETASQPPVPPARVV